LLHLNLAQVLTTMNKYLIYLLFFSSSLIAQTEKGKFLIAGSSNFSFTSIKIEDESSRRTELSLETGLFIKDNFAVGLTIPYSFTRQTSGFFDGVSTSSTIVFAPTVYYYLGSSNFRPYVVGLAGYGKNKTKYITSGSFGFEDDRISKRDVLSYELGAGVSNFINDFVSIDLYLGYSTLVFFQENEFSLNFFGSSEANTTVGFGLNVGFRLFL